MSVFGQFVNLSVAPMMPAVMRTYGKLNDISVENLKEILQLGVEKAKAYAELMNGEFDEVNAQVCMDNLLPNFDKYADEVARNMGFLKKNKIGYYRYVGFNR